MKFLSGTIILIFVLAYTSAAPVSTPKQCSKKCDELSNLLNYKIGKKYVYDFKNKIISDIPKGTTERAQIELKAKAEFNIISKCEIVLTLSGVSMKETLLKDGETPEVRSLETLAKQLQKNALSFGFNAGRVTNLCPKPEEERIPLNVKRAIISQFQISMEHLETPTSLTERDVSGDCLTQYRFKGRSSNNIQIVKTKSILGCANRKKSYSDLQGVSFDRPTENSQMPLLKGNLDCNLQVSLERHLVSSECKEKQVFRPFSGKKSGVTISVSQSLSLNTISESTIKPTQIAEDSVTNLLLNHSPDGYRDFRADDDMQTAEDVLKQICSDIQKDALSTSKVIAKSFPKFVRLLRDLDAKGLKAIQGKIGVSFCKKNQKTAKGVFQDAIPMINTPDSIKFILSELTSGKSTDYRRSWLFSLATVREPTIEIIKELDKIGGKLNNPLIVSSIVATYCKTNDMCAEEEAVKSIVKRITSDLGADCGGNKEKVLLALRAIGNLGMASNWKALYQCSRNTKISMLVRVSAVQAMRKVGCESAGWDEVDLMKIYQLPNEDPELRINAYLSLITCSARPGVLQSIINQLNVENCQQIGSFVWTHLTNIMETSQVFRKALRERLQMSKFNPNRYAKKFDLDYRKFSRNYEKSYFYEPFNSGLSGEANVIFSTDSFVPRAVSMNFTAGVFGKSISLIEFGARGNNVDQLFRSVYQSQKQQKGDGSKMIHFSIDKFKQQTFGKKIGKPTADLYLRMFGNELAYVSDLGLDALSGRNTAETLSRLGMALKDMKFENSRMMMEAVVSVPTLSGFPIELSIDLASSIRMSAGMQMTAKGDSTSVMANYDPSGAIGLVGRMRLNAQDTEIGIEFHGMMYRNFKMGGKLTFNPNEVTLTMDSPQEKATVIDLSSQMFLIHKRSHRLQAMKAKRSKFNLCNTKRSQKVFGLQMCLDVNYGNNSQIVDGPSFPFTGNNQMKIEITPLAKVSQFMLRGKYVSTRNTLMGVQSFELEMNAVGSKVDRQLLFAFNDNSNAVNVDMSLKMFSPIKKIEVTAKGDLGKRKIDASLKVDKKTLLQLTTKHSIKGSRSVTTIVLDADKAPKLIEATYSSDTSLTSNELDHVLEFKSKQFYVTRFKVTLFRKVADDLSISSKYGFDIAGKEFSSMGQFDFNFKENAADGKILMIISDAKEPQFKWLNKFSMTTVKDKAIKNGRNRNIVTEHSIKFSNNLYFGMFYFYNDIKDGSFVIQHDYSPNNPETNRFLYYKLIAEDLQHKTTFQLSQTQNPFALVFDTYLGSKKWKLNFSNELNVIIDSWKTILINETFMNNQQKYALLVENSINTEKKVQEAKVVFPKRIYHIQSRLLKTGQTAYSHTARVAWGPNKSYDIKSTIDWDTALDIKVCKRFYQINSSAFQNGQRLGKFYINLCPNMKDKALSLEAKVSGKDREIGSFRSDAVFKTMGNDFHIGGSVQIDLPSVFNMMFRSNHIYAGKKKKQTEIMSDVMVIYKRGAKKSKTYGYELTGSSDAAKTNGKLNIHYVHPYIGQVKSTYEVETSINKTIKEIGVKTKIKMTSKLIGNAEITSTTNLEMKNSVPVSINMVNVYSGQLSLFPYKFDGEETFSVYYNNGKLNVVEKCILNLKSTNAVSKSRTYNYNYQLEMNNLNRLLQMGIKLDFNSNFDLKKLTYKGKCKYNTNKEGGFKFTSYDDISWTFSGQDGSLNWKLNAVNTADSFSAESDLSSSIEQLKKLKFTAKVIKKTNEPSINIYGKYNDKQSHLTIGAKYAMKPASGLEKDPDFELTIAMKGDIPSVRDGKLTIKTYYQQDIKFILFDTSIVHNGPHKSKLFFNGGYSEPDMLAKVELGMSTPYKTPELKMKIGVDGITDSNLEPIGPVSQRLVMISKAEVSFVFGEKNNIKFVVSQKSTKKNTQFISESNMVIANKAIIPKGTKMILKFEGNDLKANKGKLYFVKNSDATFETFEQTFDYDFAKQLTFKTQTSFQSKKRFFVVLEWPNALDNKSFELYFKPSAEKKSFLFDYKLNFISTALNFNSSLLLRVPKLIDNISLNTSLFQSLKGETKKTDLLDKAFIAFSLSLSTSFKQLAKFQLKAAATKFMKGQLTLNVVSKKTVNLKINADLSNLAKITGSVDFNDKKIEVSLERKAKDAKLIVKANGKKVGEAKITYKAGQSLEVNLDATSPNGEKVVLKVKHEHPKGKWDWRQWKHDGSIDISKGGNRIFKGSQALSFQSMKAKKESMLTVNIETSVAALKVFKMNSGLGWSDGLSTKLNVELQGLSNSRLNINHNVKKWQKFYLSMMNKIDFTGANSNFRFILNSECNPSPVVIFEIGGNVIPYISLIHISSNEKFVIKFFSKSEIGNIDLETNILAEKPQEVYYIRGQIPSHGNVALVFVILGDKKYKLKMELGKKFVTLYPTLVFKSLTLPFDGSLKVKIETSFEEILSGSVEIQQKIDEEYLSAEHKTSIFINGSPFVVATAGYDMLQDEKTGKLIIDYQGDAFKADVSYNPSTTVYKHNILVMRKARGNRPLFESITDCSPYEITADVGKCYLSGLFDKNKMVFDVANDLKGNKRTKSLKLAWNDLKKQFVKVVYEILSEDISQQVSLTFQTPIRSYRFQRKQELETGSTSELKFSTLSPDLKKITGFVYIFMKNKPMKGEDYEYTVRIQSSLLKKEIKTVVNYAIGDEDKLTVKADMYIEKSTPSLSMTFKMAGFAKKRDLELKLTGGKRYLNMFLNYDDRNPVKELKVGARAKDWKRELKVLYEPYRMLETVVDTGKNKQTVKFVTEPIQQNSGFRHTLIIDYPEVKGFLKIMLQLNRSPVSVMVIVQRDKAKPENQLVINGRFMNSRNILMEIKRINGSNQITDAYMQVTLSTDKIIQTNLKWRPAVFSDAKDFLLNELAPTKMNQYLKNRGEGLLAVLQRASSEVAGPIKANIKLQTILDAAQALVNDFMKMNDQFVSVLQTIKMISTGSRMSKSLEDISKIFQQIKTYVRGFFDGISKSKALPFSLDLQKLYDGINTQYQMVYDGLKECTKELNDSIIINFLSNAKGILTNTMQNFYAWLDKATKVTKKWAEQRDKLLTMVKECFRVTTSSTSDYFKMIKEFMKDLQGTITGAIVERLFSKEDLQEWSEVATKLKLLNNWLTSSIFGSRKFSDLQLSMQLLGNGDLKKAFVTYFKPDKNKILTWKLKQGFASWQMYFPYDIRSLQSVPAAILSYTRTKLRSTLKEIRQGSFALGKYYRRLNELLFRFSLKEALRRQMPPFKAHAWISGSQHFVTFDGVSVEHSGACTYLLAHDFVNHGFSVLGEYVMKGKMVMRKNLIVQTNQAAIYISPKGEIKVRSGKAGEPQSKRAPLAFGDLFVSRWGNVLKIKGPNDLSIRCLLDLDVCRLTVSQWSHGHINGFLGSNDYEKCNDIYKANENNPYPFCLHADAWKVGKCEAKKNDAITHESYSKDSESYRSCSILDRAGYFSRCFSKVDPNSYLKSCMNMHKMARNMGSGHVCRIFQMYVSKCRSKGIILQMPRTCMTCGKSSPRDWMKYRRPFSIQQKFKKNFVFLVEAKPCIKQITNVFKELIKTILSSKEDDTYNLITFGGEGNFRDPTLHMLDNRKTRGNKDLFEAGLNQVLFNGKDSVDDGKIATKAVQMALLHDDDVSSATVVVLISCSKCKESAKYQYTNMQRRYSKRGFRFHYFIPHDFGQVGDNQVAGFASPTVFNEKGSRVDMKFLARIKHPRDTCSALARSTSGSYWDTNTLLKMNGAIRESMLKNTLKRQKQNKRTCFCAGSYNNDDIIRCRDRK